MNRTATPARLLLHGLLVVGVLATAAAQGPKPAAYEDWKSLEASEELRNYRKQLLDGVFNDASRDFLATIALPQIALPKNRPEIDRIRHKMVDRLCVADQEGGNAKGTISAQQAIVEFMTTLARNGKADLAARVNAVLLIGELPDPASPGRKVFWAEAVPPLVAMLKDDALPPAVRIAAAAGLARHVESDPKARAAEVGPAALQVASSAFAGVDVVAADWLRSRSLVMLSRMGAAAPDGTAAAAARILVDTNRPFDVRVRAAATLGGSIKAAGDTDVAAAVGAVRTLAAAALADTQARIDRRDLAVRLAGGAAPGAPQPDIGGMDATAGFSELHRRDAWRLATLADALDPGDGAGGLARVAGPTADAATALAATLRQAAAGLDQRPDAVALRAAVQALAAAHDGAAAAGDAGATKPAAGESEGVDGIPFGGR